MKKLFEVVGREALLSDEGRYRYWLTRTLEATDSSISLTGKLTFIMLNPSTANSLVDDATIRRCMGFCYRFGCRNLVVVNLFALRSKDPGLLYEADYPIGPDNDFWIEKMCRNSKDTVAAWGTDGAYMRRDRDVLKMLSLSKIKPVCLGKTRDGFPRHPLYLSNEARRVEIAV